MQIKTLPGNMHDVQIICIIHLHQMQSKSGIFTAKKSQQTEHILKTNMIWYDMVQSVEFLLISRSYFPLINYFFFIFLNFYLQLLETRDE